MPLLALLKHPLVGGEGEQRLAWLDAVRALDLALRGPRPRAGLDGLDERFAEKKADRAWKAASRHRWRISASASWCATLAQLAAQLRELVEPLAGDAAWRGPDGRLAAELLAELEQSAGRVADRGCRPTMSCRSCGT